MAVFRRRSKGTRRTNGTRGTSIVETLAGLFVLIPVVLFLVDVAALVLAQTANDHFAKSAARAAAETATAAQATLAVQQVQANFPSSSICSNPTIDNLMYDTPPGRVTVITRIRCNLPVVVPGVNPFQDFVSDATEPVVGRLN